jgi:hypothetical protein
MPSSAIKRAASAAMTAALLGTALAILTAAHNGIRKCSGHGKMLVDAREHW